MTPPASKAQAREQARDRLKALDPIARIDHAATIRRRLLDLPELAEADTIFAYVSVHEEVATHKLLDQLLELGKTVAVPVVVGEDIVPHLLNDLEDLYPDRYDIPAPQTRIPLETTPDLTLVPGLAFTPQGHRLGRGGGFYDRFLQLHPDTLPIGLAYNTQLVKTLPEEAHDHPVKILLTEATTHRP